MVRPLALRACPSRRSQTRLRCPRVGCRCGYGYGCGYSHGCGLASLDRARRRTPAPGSHGAFTSYGSLLAVFLFHRNPSMSESDRRPKYTSESVKRVLRVAVGEHGVQRCTCTEPDVRAARSVGRWSVGIQYSVLSVQRRHSLSHQREAVNRAPARAGANTRRPCGCEGWRAP